jgi:hypothetical protein
MKRRKQVLFHAIPAESHQSQRDWTNFLRDASFVELPEQAEQLAPNVWVLPDDNRSYLLLSCVAQKNAIETRILPFSTGSDWQPLSTHP